MKLSRRQFLIHSSSALALGVLSACAPSGDAPAAEPSSADAGAEAAPAQETTTMVYHSWEGPPQSSAGEVGIDQFMETNPDITVEYRQTPFAEYWKSLLTDISVGQPPDVYLMNNFFWQQHIDQGIVTDITSAVAIAEGPATNEDEFIPSVWQAAKREGKLYGIPKAINSSAFILNKTIFDEQGVDLLPASPEDYTWAQFEETAAQLTDADAKRFGCAVVTAVSWIPTFLFSNGGRLLDPEEHRTAVGYMDSEANAEWVRWISGLVSQGYMPEPAGLDAFGGMAGAMFGGNTAITHTDGFHQVHDAKAQGIEYEWAGVKTPIPEGGEMRPHLAIHATMVPTGVADVLKSTELGGYIVNAYGTDLENPLKLSPLTEYAQQQVEGDFSYLRPIYDQALNEEAQVHEGALITYLDILSEEWDDMIERVLLEGADPMQSLQTAAANYDERVAEAQS